MSRPDWRAIATTMLDYERRSKSLHHPPSIGIILEWRSEKRFGCIHVPVLQTFPAVALLSITSIYVDPEFFQAIRNLDPARLQLAAEDRLDLSRGNSFCAPRRGSADVHARPRSRGAGS